MLSPSDKDHLYSALCHDTVFQPSRETFDMFLEHCKELEFKAKKNIVVFGEINDEFWMVAKGVARMAYYNVVQEVTYGFGGPGTMFISPMGFVKHTEANFHIISLSSCVMLRMDKNTFTSLLRKNHEFCLWINGAMMYQFLACEAWINARNVPANIRVEKLMKGLMEEDYDDINPNMKYNRRKVPMRVLASYLGITRTHMAHLIKDMYNKDSLQKGNKP